MSRLSLFVDDDSVYKNQVDPVKYSMRLSKLYLKISKGKEYSDKDIQDLYIAHGAKPPVATYYSKKKNGDREKKQGSLLNFVLDTKANNEVMAPSFSTFSNSEVSLQAEFINDGLTQRKSEKKLAKEAESVKDFVGFNIHNTLQKSFKIRNNSLSGAYYSPSTIFWNVSSHNVLTSATMIAASIGNTVSELFIGGRLIYSSPDAVYNHMLAIIDMMDSETVKSTLKHYNIVYPTVDDVMFKVTTNTDYYFRDSEAINAIRTFVTKLTDEQRAMVMYCNDGFHMRKINETFYRDMILSMARPCANNGDTVEYIYDTDDEVLNLTYHVCIDKLRGHSIDFNTYSPALLDMFTSTIKNIERQLLVYKKLIDCFYKVPLIPPNSIDASNMVNSVIALGDTDSTCSSYDEWVIDNYGVKDTGATGVAYSAVVGMFNGGILSSALKQLACNMNTRETNYSRIDMKSEFYFPTFIVSNASKQYVANIGVKEGMVYDTNKLELKGVNYLASNHPEEFRKDFNSLVDELTTRFGTKSEITAKELLDRIISSEINIEERAIKADPTILKTVMIKSPDSYKQDWDKNVVYYHRMWQEVFSDKYGKADDLPIQGVRIPLTLSKPADLKQFVLDIKDVEIREKATEWFKKHPKNGLGQIVIPLNIVMTKGVPEELKDYMDISKLVLSNLSAHYILLESLGLWRKTRGGDKYFTYKETYL